MWHNQNTCSFCGFFIKKAVTGLFISTITIGYDNGIITCLSHSLIKDPFSIWIVMIFKINGVDYNQNWHPQGL